MEILLYKKTKDSDLSKGMQVCYKNLQGAYTQLGIITDIVTAECGTKNYLINTSFGSYTADELKLIKKDNLNGVKVYFADSSLNYYTSVSAQSTKESTEQYFVGKHFNMGVFPIENMQKCIAIEFINNNL